VNSLRVRARHVATLKADFQANDNSDFHFIA